MVIVDDELMPQAGSSDFMAMVEQTIDPQRISRIEDAGQGDDAEALERPGSRDRAITSHRRVRHDAPASRHRKETHRMSDDFTTDQAEREASGAHPYGRYLEEFEIGAVYKHWPAKTVTESEDHLFCLLTMNHHPLHVNDVYAAASQQGRNVVVGPMVYSLALGMSVSDVSGKAIANLQTEELKHPAPVFHGDTLFCETEVLEKRESKTKLDRGTVRVHTRVLNQDGVLVAEFKRLVLVPRKEHGTAEPAEAPVE
jgi:acyl dehydratase